MRHRCYGLVLLFLALLLLLLCHGHQQPSNSTDMQLSAVALPGGVDLRATVALLDADDEGEAGGEDGDGEDGDGEDGEGGEGGDDVDPDADGGEDSENDGEKDSSNVESWVFMLIGGGLVIGVELFLFLLAVIFRCSFRGNRIRSDTGDEARCCPEVESLTSSSRNIAVPSNPLQPFQTASNSNPTSAGHRDSNRGERKRGNNNPSKVASLGQQEKGQRHSRQGAGGVGEETTAVAVRDPGEKLLTSPGKSCNYYRGGCDEDQYSAENGTSSSTYQKLSNEEKLRLDRLCNRDTAEPEFGPFL